MVIKNKDGSVYKLRSPNALMKDQRFWTDYKSHNMKWKLTITEGESEVERVQTDFVMKDSFVEELASTAPVRDEQKPQEPPVAKTQKVEDPLDGIPRCFIYCLPASMSQKRDALYDDEYISIKYGEPYSLEGVMTEEHDLCINFWTTADIPRESVIFPKNNQKRWWKVVGSEVSHGGKVYVCAPSTYQPHFEGT
jgi:hypothetical protein